MQTARQIVDSLSLSEKIRLVCGKNFWQTTTLNGKIPRITFSDGPTGVRKQEEGVDNLGLNSSVKATCFPTATNLSSTFDRKLVCEVGDALAKECKQYDVDVILAPGMNIKRNPLCGRNFEYFSEDTYLTQEISKSYIKGIQRNDISACIKHFACNSQEDNRMQLNCVVDERALREIYLSAFENVIKQSHPDVLMASYNKVNGVYASENKYLLHDILREEWGYKGLTITDWGACNKRVLGLMAGLDLEMPTSLGYSEKQISKAIRNKKLDVKYLNFACENIVKLALKIDEHRSKYKLFTVNFDYHNNLARRVATQSMVLLKNDDTVLPLAKNEKIGVIGRFAINGRFQGNGSSIVNSYATQNFVDVLTENRILYDYTDGYDENHETDERLLAKAKRVAYENDKVIVFIGLPSIYESEGWDRRNICLPNSHNKLVEEVANINENTIVVLCGGGVIEMLWIDKVKGVLHSQLGGQAVAGGIFDTLFGDYNPSGRLNETYVKSLSDVPSLSYFDFDRKTDEYRDSIYVGYRYYNTSNTDVQFPFGYGLSYTKFEYSNLKLSTESVNLGSKINVSFDIENAGNYDGNEVYQVYVQINEKLPIAFAKQQLKYFDKVFIKQGNKISVSFNIDSSAFTYFNTHTMKFELISGNFSIGIGSNSRDIRIQQQIAVIGTTDDLPDYSENYLNFTAKSTNNLGDFRKLKFSFFNEYKKKIFQKYSINSSIEDLQKTLIGKIIKRIMMKQLNTMGNPNYYRLMKDNPLRTLISMSGGVLSSMFVTGVIKVANKKYISGYFRILLAVLRMKKIKK